MNKLKKTIIPMYVFSFLKNLHFFGTLAVPFYLYRLGVDFTTMFLIEVVFSAGLFLSEIPTGVIADKFGRKVSLAAGSVLLGLSFIVIGTTHSIGLIIFAQMFGSCGMSMISGADRALLFELSREIDSDPSKAAVYAARYDALGTAAMFLSYPAGTLFASSGIMTYTDALGASMWVTGCCLIIGAAAVLMVNETKRVQTHESAVRHGIDGFKYIFKKPQLTRFSINYALSSSMMFMMFWLYQPLLERNSFPPAFQGFVSSAFNGGAMILLLLVPAIRSKKNMRRILFYTSIIPGLMYFLPYFFPGLPSALAAIFGITILRQFRIPVMSSLINTQIEDSNRATVLSGVSMIERILTTALYPLVGLLLDVSFSTSFLILGSAAVLVSLLTRIEDKHL